MIVDPDFFDHWRTRMVVDALYGDEMAPLYVQRIWAHCQREKRWRFDMPAAGLKGLCKFPGDAQELEKALIDAGYIERDGAAIHVPKWAEYNSQLIAAWNNGKTGGRPKGSRNRAKTAPEKPTENPQVGGGQPADNPQRTPTEAIEREDMEALSPSLRAGERDARSPEAPQVFAPAPATAAEIGAALIRGGLNPMTFSQSHPKLLGLVELGATAQEVEDTTREVLSQGGSKGLGYIAAAIRGRREDAARETARSVGGAVVAGTQGGMPRVLTKQELIEARNAQVAAEWAAGGAPQQQEYGHAGQ